MAVERTDTGRGPRPDHPQIGERLRERRHELGLSLRELADRLGVSPSLISQIERGRANPSVSTLYALVAELGVSLDEMLFNERRAEHAVPEVERGGPIQRANERQRIRLASGVIWERLTTRSEPGVEFLHVVYEVGGASGPEDSFQRHAGHEWGHVISGVLSVRDRVPRIPPRAGRLHLARLDDPASAGQRGRHAGPCHLVRRRARCVR